MCVIDNGLYFVASIIFWGSSWLSLKWRQLKILLNQLIGMESAMTSTWIQFCQNIRLFGSLKTPMYKTIPIFFFMLSIVILSWLLILQLLIGCAVWESCVFSTMFYNSSLVTNNSKNLIRSQYFVRLSMSECNWSFLYSKFDSFGTVHLLIFFFYLGFLSRTFSNHRTAGEEGGHFFNSSLPLPPASQTLRH